MSVSVGVAANALANRGEYTDSGQILAGAATASNTVSAQTVITIPAGRTWVGSIVCGASNTTANTSIDTAQVKTAGATVTPAAGTALLTVHDSILGTTAVGPASQNNSINDVIIAAGSSAATVTLTNSTATTFTSDCSAVGVLL